MRIEIAYLGDPVARTNRSGSSYGYVAARCIGTREPQAYACLSCYTVVPDVARMVEHIGLLPDRIHALAQQCRDCWEFHQVTQATVVTIRGLAQLWPLVPDPGATAAADLSHEKAQC